MYQGVHNGVGHSGHPSPPPPRHPRTRPRRGRGVAANAPARGGRAGRRRARLRGRDDRRRGAPARASRRRPSTSTSPTSRTASWPPTRPPARSCSSACARRTRSHDDWLERTRAGVRAYLRWLAAEPALARVFLIEVAAAGPQALERREALRDRYAELVRERRGAQPRAAVRGLPRGGGGGRRRGRAPHPRERRRGPAGAGAGAGVPAGGAAGGPKRPSKLRQPRAASRECGPS